MPRKKKTSNLMKVQSISPDELAKFLESEFPTHSFDELKTLADLKSYAKKNCYWAESCKKLFPNLVDERSRMKWSKELYRCFNDKTIEIETIFNSIRSTALQEVLFPAEDKLPCYESFSRVIKTFDVNSYDIQTLEPKKFLNDKILNAFIAIQVDTARRQGLKIMAFETILTSQIMEGNISDGNMNWLVKHSLLPFDIWLFPINFHRIHWTLAIIDIKRKVIMYLDSMHHDAPSFVIDGIISLIEIHHEINKVKCNIEKWKIYSSLDVPRQDDGWNSGVHVAIYTFMICNRVKLQYTVSDPRDKPSKKYLSDCDRARIGICQIIMNENTGCPLENIERNELRKTHFETLEQNKEIIKKAQKKRQDSQSNTKFTVKKLLENSGKTFEYCTNLFNEDYVFVSQ